MEKKKFFSQAFDVESGESFPLFFYFTLPYLPGSRFSTACLSGVCIWFFTMAKGRHPCSEGRSALWRSEKGGFQTSMLWGIWRQGETSSRAGQHRSILIKPLLFVPSLTLTLSLPLTHTHSFALIIHGYSVSFPHPFLPIILTLWFDIPHSHQRRNSAPRELRKLKRCL